MGAFFVKIWDSLPKRWLPVMLLVAAIILQRFAENPSFPHQEQAQELKSYLASYLPVVEAWIDPFFKWLSIASLLLLFYAGLADMGVPLPKSKIAYDALLVSINLVAILGCLYVGFFAVCTSELGEIPIMIEDRGLAVVGAILMWVGLYLFGALAELYVTLRSMATLR